jgi:hypothetical protein
MLLLIGLGMTYASAGVERAGPERRVEGEGFCPGAEPCTVPVVGGGFPVPYLIDDPQVSVPNALGFAEDDIRWGAFALDVAFWIALGWGAVTFAPWKGRRERRAEREGTNESST